MSHWVIAPVVLPLLAGVLLLFVERDRPRWQAPISLAATFGLMLIGARLLAGAASGEYAIYLVGNWAPPFGIVLAVDRLSALMVTLAAVVGLATLVYALSHWHARGAHFHALFQFQLMGLNGAFLTGDLFNLFVFFEVLLIASYGLLLHGAGRERVRAATHYVTVNLVGSAFFLIAVGLLYGVAGTLNMADLALKVAALAPADAAIARAAALLLLVVFCLKAAVVPIGLWLPYTYASATAPVGALFVIMTKVGVYSVLRVYSLVFGAGAGDAADVAVPWLLAFGALTILIGALGAVAARRLRELSACLIVVSAGTLLTSLGLTEPGSTGGAMYYLVQSTLVGAALFLIADMLAAQRGSTEDRFDTGPRLAQPALLGGLYFFAAMTAAGLPPSSGFIGKTMILAGALGDPGRWLAWSAILSGSFLAVVALSRAGSRLFWKTADEDAAAAGRAGPWTIGPALTLIACGVLLSVYAGPAQRYVYAAAEQIHAPGGYVAAVLGAEPVVRRTGAAP